jgi:hypothetical protein
VFFVVDLLILDLLWGTFEHVVIPAKAGIHFDLSRLKLKQNGFPLSRE